MLCSAMRQGVLVLGNFRQTVTVVRSLAGAGYRTIVGAEELKVLTRHSRATAELWLHPPLEEEAAFRQALAQFLGERSDIEWIFPVGEDEARFLVRHAAALPSRAGLVMPEPRVVETCLHKPSLYEIAM